jgi:hypothetical protein
MAGWIPTYLHYHRSLSFQPLCAACDRFGISSLEGSCIKAGRCDSFEASLSFC